MVQFFRETHIDFMQKRNYAIGASVIVILIGLASLLIKGGPAYSIDFLGGTEIHVQFPQDQTPGAVREALTSLGYSGAEIKQFGGNRDYLIRVQQEENALHVPDNILAALHQAFPANPPEMRSVDTVGPKIGRELRGASIWATLISLGLILIYVSFRFEFIFAVGAVVALFHDVIVTLGFFSLFNLEINLAVVAAFLTLVGYSLNDTIVIFDRIRENLKVHRRENMPMEDLINLSINQTLSRTILTSLTVFFVVVVLFLFGGEVIHSFAFCMLVGVIAGSYSTIFIAATMVVEWYKKHHLAKIKQRAPVAAR
ncbi:MAG: protein translocase subunit SecF [candidate division KSB1 bacterium]